MAPHSSILAWKIPWTEEPGGLQKVGMTGYPCTHLEGKTNYERMTPFSYDIEFGMQVQRHQIGLRYPN